MNMFVELWCLYLFSVSVANCNFSVQNGDGIRNYYGTVHENIETRVKLMPPLRFPSGEICDIRIKDESSSFEYDSAQFVLEKANSVDYNNIVYDEWLLRTKRSLDYEKQKNYKFHVFLRPCRLNGTVKSTMSHNATVHVTVLDENEYIPEFVDQSYVAEVEEGKLYDNILQLKVIDRDEGPINGLIYKYAILPERIDSESSQVLFGLSKDGVLRNLHPLNYSKSHNHILSVVAYDGGHKVSKSVLVTIKVKKACRPEWSNLPQTVKYSVKSTTKFLIPANSHLEVCDRCQNGSTKFKIELGLHVRHLGKNCNDHITTYQSEKHLCKTKQNEHIVELLPFEKDEKAFGKWFEDRPITSFIDSDVDSDEIYYFNGQSTALSVPEDYFDENKLNSIFTISSWIKHDQHLNQDKHIKEHIICSADDHSKNCNDHITTYQSEKHLCKTKQNEHIVELLPFEKDEKAFGKWFEDRPITSFIDSDVDSDEIYYFNGQSTALSVPEDYFDENKLNSIFTISSWIKHDQHLNQDKHIKEHIICSADDHKMNRHHYAVFIRNCRLILLLRRDFTNGDLNIFKPAEWRWKLSQICDNQWHHYAITVNFPNVQLYIDGQPYSDSKNTSEIIDDWPLHPTNEIHTRLTVGGCWQGTESRIKHFFNGYLAGLTILTNQTIEQTRQPFVSTCLFRCHEQLQIPPLDFLQPGMELVTNNDQNAISVSSAKVEDLENLIKQVGYTNNENLTSLKKRHLNLITYRQCGEQTIELDNRVINILITKDMKTVGDHVTLNGTSHLVRKHTELENGVRIFPDLAVQSSDHDLMIGLCIISINPPLNGDHENLSVMNADNFKLQVLNEMNSKIKISGSDTMFTYRQVLRQVQYTNTKPFYYLSRVFKVVCQDEDGSQKSNEYVQTVSFLHPKVKEIVATAVRGPLHSALIQDPKEYDHLHSKFLYASMGSSFSFTIVVFLCAGFLLFLVLMGTFHVRGHLSGNMKTSAVYKGYKSKVIANDIIPESEMVWDDSGMSIIVNPMENLEQKLNPVASATYSQSDSDQYDDEDEYEDDDREDYNDDDIGQGLNTVDVIHVTKNCTKTKRSNNHQYQHVNQLEWDHSTL